MFPAKFMQAVGRVMPLYFLIVPSGIFNLKNFVMKKATVYSATVKGTNIQVKAYKKSNAIKRFQQLDSSINKKMVFKSAATNSHQGVIEELYPELFS